MTKKIKKRNPNDEIKKALLYKSLDSQYIIKMYGLYQVNFIVLYIVVYCSFTVFCILKLLLNEI